MANRQFLYSATVPLGGPAELKAAANKVTEVDATIQNKVPYFVS